MVNLDHSTEKWGIAIAATFAALVVFSIPIINLIRLLPTFKEILIGAAVVFLLLDTTDLVDGAVFMLVSGMVAAVLFNVVRFVLFSVLGVAGVLGGGGGPGGMGGAGAMGGELGLAAIGALVQFIGVVIFSPVGYAVGGAVGAFLNENA